MGEPPMIHPKDLKEWVTLGDLLDMHEALDLKEAFTYKQQAKR